MANAATQDEPSNAMRLLKWTVPPAIIGFLVAPVGYVPTSAKLLTLAVALILFGLWLKRVFVRWVKSNPKAPTWDEIQSVSPIEPEPKFKSGGPIGRAVSDCFAKWTLNRKDKEDPIYLNALAEMFDMGTKHTPKNPVEAMRCYKAAVGGGDPAKANGPHYAKLRIAEMYEDGEGVAQDLAEAARIYKTIPHYPSAMFHFAIAHVHGRGVPQDYIESYKLLLLADKYYSWHAPSRKEVEVQVQAHRSNRRHIRVRKMMAIFEGRMAPEQLLRGREAARAWWNANR
jgi:hypothetical protein